MKETANALVPKEHLDYIEDQRSFVDFITDEITKALTEKVMNILEHEEEILLKRPELRVSEYPPTNSVEYRKTLTWEPLVRCRNCRYWLNSDEECVMMRSRLSLFEKGKKWNGNSFCSFGEPKEGGKEE